MPALSAVRPPPAGTLPAPLRHAGDLTGEAVAACELLVIELRTGSWLIQDGSRRTGLLRSLVATRVTLHLLPPVVRDWDGRYALALTDEGTPPRGPDHPDLVLSAYADRLQTHLQQNDHQDWVDPDVLAGDVANAHDHIVQTLLWHEMFGDDPQEPDGPCTKCDATHEYGDEYGDE